MKHYIASAVVTFNTFSKGKRNPETLTIERNLFVKSNRECVLDASDAFLALARGDSKYEIFTPCGVALGDYAQGQKCANFKCLTWNSEECTFTVQISCFDR